MREEIRGVVAARRCSDGAKNFQGGVIFSGAYFNPSNTTR
jgi:hypothetical protein